MPHAKPDLSRQAEMAELILQLAPQEGHTRSLLDGVRLMRADRPLGRTPVLYEPSIVIVCQGHKRGYLANRIYHYDPQHYLVLSVPLPFSTETDASPQEPLLAVSVRLDMTAVADLVIEVDQQASPMSTAPAGIVSTPLDTMLADTTVRLLKALRSPLEARVLGQPSFANCASVFCLGNEAAPSARPWPATATSGESRGCCGASIPTTPSRWTWLRWRVRRA